MSQGRMSAVGEASVTVSWAGRSVPLLIRYPARRDGSGAPFDEDAAPAPALAFGHGFLAPAGAYRSTLGRLAAAGCVVVAPDSERGYGPSHAVLADDLRRSLTWVADGAGGVLGGPDAVDASRLGLAGHSMGGGCAVLAAVGADPGVRTVATLAAARTRPSALEAAARLTVPTLFLAAERDAIAPVEVHQRPLFEAVREGTPAQLRIIRGGSHIGFCDPVGRLGPRWVNRPVLPRHVQRRLAGDLLVRWFLLCFGSRPDLWEDVWRPAEVERTDVTFEVRGAPPTP